jgi:hypothetical protein
MKKDGRPGLRRRERGVLVASAQLVDGGEHAGAPEEAAGAGELRDEEAGDHGQEALPGDPGEHEHEADHDEQDAERVAEDPQEVRARMGAVGPGGGVARQEVGGEADEQRACEGDAAEGARKSKVFRGCQAFVARPREFTSSIYARFVARRKYLKSEGSPGSGSHPSGIRIDRIGSRSDPHLTDPDRSDRIPI